MPEGPDRVPEVDELDRLCQALHGFLEQDRFSVVSATSGAALTSEQEKGVLPRFEQLADAVRSVRDKKIQGWPTAIRRAIPRIVETFDGITRRWGWEGIAQPDPVRSTYLEQCRAWVEEGMERPMYEAALSVSEQWDRPGPCLYDNMADEARRRGMVVTMSLEEALAQVEAALTRFDTVPHLGRCYPRLEEQEVQALVQAFWTLHPYLTEIASEQCVRPPRQEQAATQPRAAGMAEDPLPTPKQLVDAGFERISARALERALELPHDDVENSARAAQELGAIRDFWKIGRVLWVQWAKKPDTLERRTRRRKKPKE
jgi:hypothetical protein